MNGEYVGILAYADDLLLLDGLQEMIKTCEIYGNDHNLTFSTNPITNKCKTKCLAFLKKARSLRNLQLNGRDLPWVDVAKHLGCRIGPNNQGLTLDLLEKRAVYINRVNELKQEFSYAHPLTKIMIKKVFNTHFYGSQLWDLFTREAARLEKTWNTSVRMMLDVPRNTHRFFIEPLSEMQHIIFSLMKRFVNFVRSITSSKKCVLRNMLEIVERDCRSTTGRNLRKIMLLLIKTNIKNISKDDLTKLQYHPANPGDEWKIQLAKELTKVKNNELIVENLNTAEMDEIMIHILT